MQLIEFNEQNTGHAKCMTPGEREEPRIRLKKRTRRMYDNVDTDVSNKNHPTSSQLECRSWVIQSYAFDWSTMDRKFNESFAPAGILSRHVSIPDLVPDTKTRGSQLAYTP